MIDAALRLALAPVLVAQGAWVAARTPSLPEALGHHSGAIGEGPPLRVLFVGDSSMAGVGVIHLDDALPGQILSRLAPHFAVTWHMHARSGATTASTSRTLPPHKCDIAIVALGVNDLTRLVPLRRWLAQTEALIEQLETGGARQVHLSAMPPVGRFPAIPSPLSWVLGRQAARMTEGLAALARRRGALLHILPETALTPDMVASDGFHPGHATYAVWGEMVASAILRTPDTPPGG
ncbi:MAG: SGNH/GDSL hydrolase family protein [Pseudomonadota bacterium]